MIAETKMEVLRAVEGAGLPVNQVLAQLGIARLESRSVFNLAFSCIANGFSI